MLELLAKIAAVKDGAFDENPKEKLRVLEILDCQLSLILRDLNNEL